MKINIMFIVVFVIAFSSSLLFAGATDDFVITVKTDNSGTSSDTQFTIPTNSNFTYNYNVDCDNDGTNDLTSQTDNATCNYSSAGAYTIRIKDNTVNGTGFPAIYFNGNGDKNKILSVNQWGTGKWKSMSRAFMGCSNLDNATAQGSDLNTNSLSAWATGKPDLSNVTDMSWMFSNAEKFNQYIGDWNTLNVTNMEGMFYGASSFNQDISSCVLTDCWYVDNVTNMSRMFEGATAFNQNIGNWWTGKVTNMSYMFSGALAFNQNIGNWDTSKVTDFSFMFNGASSFNQDIGNWQIGNATGMNGMFLSASKFDRSLGDWDVSNVTDMYWMFNLSNISTQNYDATLIGWSKLPSLQNNVRVDSLVHYCTSESARKKLIDTYHWTISDAGKECKDITPVYQLLLSD